MDKKSEEYLRQYIKLTDNLKQKIEAHAARYHIKKWYCTICYIVRLHHREGEELLFALAFQNDDTIIVLETENDNDMREEIQARFDAALEDGKDELDVYSEMLETGIDIKMVRKYLGDDAADHMKDFCKEHGLI